MPEPDDDDTELERESEDWQAFLDGLSKPPHRKRKRHHRSDDKPHEHDQQ
jgi:hypothetical protein